MNESARIYLAGHRGLVGSALRRLLAQRGFHDLITRTHRSLDLTRQEAVERFFARQRPTHVILAAAKVGGIGANAAFPADFCYENLAIAANVIHAAFQAGVRLLVNLGSSCIYPRLAPQPLREEYLLTGPLEPTNEAYAIAKIAALKLCRYYRGQYGLRCLSLMPTNLYGPHDDFDLRGSHVLPAVIRKLHLGRLLMEGDMTSIRRDLDRWSAARDWLSEPEEAVLGELAANGITPRKVELWGTGLPRREFLHVDDLARACLFLSEGSRPEESGEIINVGTGEDLSIAELAGMVREIVGYEGEIAFDADKPDGTPQKLLDTSHIERLGWTPAIGLRPGLEMTYRWYRQRASRRGPPARSARP